MSQQDFIRDMVAKQRARMVANLMDYFEKQIEPGLPDRGRSHARRAYKDRVMVCVGSYHDVVLDLLQSITPDPGLVINEKALEMLAEIHEALANGRSQVGAPERPPGADVVRPVEGMIGRRG